MGKKIKGFENNAQAIARKQGIPLANARAILAEGARNSSAKAKHKNPALKKVR